MNAAKLWRATRGKVRATIPIHIVVKRKALLLGALLVLVVVLQAGLPRHAALVAWYSRWVFHPFQAVRHFLLGWVPFSVGDVLYMLSIIFMVVGLVRWIYYLIRFRKYRGHLLASCIHTINVIAIAYIVFFLGWGGNYYKPSLSAFWGLKPHAWVKQRDLLAYDSTLISRLNALVPGYHPLALKEVNRKAVLAYKTFTDAGRVPQGLGAKPSVFGYFMQYMGIQGYYNPFTGEAQVNKFLPPFMLPFVVCHEMAHQSGIAAEDDANLLSYAVCTASPDTAFAYSGAFNLWLYAHARARESDSVSAKALLATLNPVSRAGLDTLRAIRKRYRGEVGRISGTIYDGYLRLHNQKDGINSYSHVTETAWAWDVARGGAIGRKIKIP